MRYTEPNPPNPEDVIVVDGVEERLRREVEALKHQLEEQKRALALKASPSHAGPGVHRPPHPSRTGLWLLAVAIVAIIAAAFFGGYIPRIHRESVIAAETSAQEQAVPVVSIVRVARSPSNSELELPGNIEAVTEAPILARADGYIARRYADIGDRVTAGQLLAELEAPELDQQVQQARANLQQAQAALEQATANYEQGKANTEMANVTAKRWSNLATKGVVSKQENDQFQAQAHSQAANLQSLEKAIAAARSNIASAEANLSRLQSMQSYKAVKAPFAGVITVRNVDVGALVSTGATLLFRIAQTNILRTYVNVPQADAGSIRVGQKAQLKISDLPGRSFAGVVTRTSNSLDPASRTLLTEIQVPNTSGALMPGTYALVDLDTPRSNPPLMLPSGAFVVRADGAQAAVVGPDHMVHFQKIQVGRDYGDHIEVLGGLEDGDSVIVNPADNVRDGVKVNPVELDLKSGARGTVN